MARHTCEEAKALREVAKRAIRWLYRMGLSAGEIAEMCGLEQRTVWNLVAGERKGKIHCCLPTGFVSGEQHEPESLEGARLPARNTMTREEMDEWMAAMGAAMGARAAVHSGGEGI